ncbi:hypothetical protein CH373_12815 [Leptospira perolatii]|uniref:SIMPL domain-containing protein n=2 Tax=Leptospira perolatii TaxID=2023191 RepID=A0A2M9ZKU5_9LEPT|nr:hypothetical protein CH360_08870 [Leptospira perolatii]PJZ72594.1 hypothetical protein CH373_12815 [Leptospira perolatii]
MNFSKKASFLFGLLFCITSTIAANENKVITVTGRGRVTLPAEIAEIRFSVESEAKTAEEAHEKTASKSDSVIKLLKSRNVKYLKTEGIRLTPQIEYSKISSSGSNKEIRGYFSSNSVVCRITLSEAGKLLDDAVKAGANQISSIRFLAEPENDEKASLEALREASRDAKKKAETVLSALGLKYKDIIEIQTFDSGYDPSNQGAIRTSSKEGVQTPIEGGTLYREATVILRISY